tara:strand:+ start:1900 stop:2538 length:639 start_codon:yes stop_codon:yes gene_type:complete
MAEARGTAQINDEISKWLDESFEDALLFTRGNNAITDVINKYIEVWRNQLEKNKHIGASRNIYQTLGTGWDFKILGKSASIILELPEYYSATDTGRKPTSAGGNGAVRKALVYQSSSLRGWIAAKGLVPSSGMEFKYKRKLANGTMKEYTRKLTAKQANRALSFMISKKIHEKGFKGTNWFSSKLKDFERDITKAVDTQFGGGDINIQIITR